MPAGKNQQEGQNNGNLSPKKIPGTLIIRRPRAARNRNLVPMAIKFYNNKIRLWKSKKKDSPGIGIHFRREVKQEVNKVHKAIEALLTFHYGKEKK